MINGFPLTVSTSSAVAQPAGLRIRLPFSGGATTFGSSSVDARQTQALRAVAAAAAMAALERTLEIAKEASDDPAPVVGKVGLEAMKPILQEVVRVQEDRSRAGAAGEKVTKVARAVKADAVLTAAALEALIKSKANAGDKTSPAIDSSLYWVASVDLPLIERAASAVRGRLVDLIPGREPDLKLEGKVQALEDRVRKLESGATTGLTPASTAARRPVAVAARSAKTRTKSRKTKKATP